MKLRISFIAFLFAVFSVSIAYSGTTSREYPYLYKSPRAMGMGGAYVAMGGRTDALFYNPAGLGNMPVDDGWEVNIIGLSGELGKKVLDFEDDMKDAFDTGDLNGDGNDGDDQLRAVNDVLREYRGTNMHFRVSDLTSIGRNYESFAFALGVLGSARFDGMTHQGFGADGLLEVNAEALYGGTAGMSYMVSEGLFLGASVKYFHREALFHTFTARELVDRQNDLEDYITDELRESGNAIGFDAGVFYSFMRDSWFRPSFGLSVLNVGDLDFGDAGKMPMTVNLGFAVSPEIPVFHSLTVGLDYVDLLGNYDQDDDTGKRLRFGGELVLYDSMFASAALRAGLYQGYPTFGAEARLTVLTISYVTYAEEIGAYAGQNRDRRHLVMLNLGW